MWDTFVLRNLQNFDNLLEYFTVPWPVSGTRNKVVFFIIFIDKNHFKKGKYGERDFKKPFEFRNFSEILYCGMTRVRNTNLSVFIQCEYTRTILRKNMGQSLFKKDSEFQNFDEIFYSGMATIRNTNFDFFFMQSQYIRTVLRKKNMGQSLLKKHSKFLIFN